MKHIGFKKKIKETKNGERTTHNAVKCNPAQSPPPFFKPAPDVGEMPASSSASAGQGHES